MRVGSRPLGCCLLAVLGLGVVLAAGCGDDEASGGGPVTAATTGAGVTTTTGAGGSVEVGACVDASAGVVLYEADATITSLAAVGERWVAAGESGYVFFNGTGAPAAPSTLLDGPHVVAGAGADAWVAAAGDATLVIQRFDATGMATSGKGGVAQEPAQALRLAAASGVATLTWTSNTRLRSRTQAADGLFAGEATTLAFGAYTTFVRLATARAGAALGVAWTGDPLPGSTRSRFLRDLLGEMPSAPAVLLDGVSHEVTGLVPYGDGWLALITGEAPARRPILQRLTATGGLIASTELAGAQYGLGLATSGNVVGILSGREDGKPMLTLLDEDLFPRPDPVCLEESYDLVRAPALAAAPDGFGVLLTRPSGQVVFHRVLAEN